jgi:hypothetical protein
MRQTLTEDKKCSTAQIVLRSTIIYGFFNGIRAGINSTVDLQKVYIADTSSTALLLINPRFLRIYDTQITKVRNPRTSAV